MEVIRCEQSDGWYIAPTDISERMQEIAADHCRDYEDQELVLVGMLKGAAFFLADLARLIPRPVDYEFVCVTSSIGDPRRGREPDLCH